MDSKETKDTTEAGTGKKKVTLVRTSPRLAPPLAAEAKQDAAQEPAASSGVAPEDDGLAMLDEPDDHDAAGTDGAAEIPSVTTTSSTTVSQISGQFLRLAHQSRTALECGVKIDSRVTKLIAAYKTIQTSGGGGPPPLADFTGAGITMQALNEAILILEAQISAYSLAAFDDVLSSAIDEDDASELGADGSASVAASAVSASGFADLGPCIGVQATHLQPLIFKTISSSDHDSKKLESDSTISQEPTATLIGHCEALLTNILKRDLHAVKASVTAIYACACDGVAISPATAGAVPTANALASGSFPLSQTGERAPADTDEDQPVGRSPPLDTSTLQDSSATAIASVLAATDPDLPDSYLRAHADTTKRVFKIPSSWPLIALRRKIVQRRIAAALAKALTNFLNAHAKTTDPNSPITKFQHILTELNATIQKTNFYSVELDQLTTPLSYLLCRLDNHQNTGGNAISLLLGAVRTRSPTTLIFQALLCVVLTYHLPIQADPLTGLNKMDEARKKAIANGTPSSSVTWEPMGLTIDPTTKTFCILSEPLMILCFLEQLRQRAFNPMFSKILETFTPPIFDRAYAGELTKLDVIALLTELQDQQIPITPTGDALNYPYPDLFESLRTKLTPARDTGAPILQGAFATIIHGTDGAQRGRQAHRGAEDTHGKGKGGKGNGAKGGGGGTRARSSSRPSTHLKSEKGEDIYGSAVTLACDNLQRVPQLAALFNDYMRATHKIENFFAIDSSRKFVLCPPRPAHGFSWKLPGEVRLDFYYLFQFFIDIGMNDKPGFQLTKAGGAYKERCNPAWVGHTKADTIALFKTKEQPIPKLPEPRVILIKGEQVKEFSS